MLLGSLRTSMGTWRAAQLERPHRGIDPPQADLLAFVEAHRAELEALRAHLTRGIVPRWEMNLERVPDAPIPNLLGHIELQKLLITDALIAKRQGDIERAHGDLDAAWTLMRSVRDQPFLIAQLIAVADARLIVGALRQIDDAPPVWGERLREHDFRRSLTTALRFEGWTWTQIEDTSNRGGLSGLATRILHRAARPYFEYCLADASDAFRRRLDNLEDVPAICDYDLASRDADLHVSIPRWNVLGGIILPNLNGAIGRLARLELDLELTARLLELERMRRENGDWPTSLPGGERSRACPRDRWVYAIGADGSARLAFARDIGWPEGFEGLRLASEFRLLPPRR